MVIKNYNVPSDKFYNCLIQIDYDKYAILGENNINIFLFDKDELAFRLNKGIKYLWSFKDIF